MGQTKIFSLLLDKSKTVGIDINGRNKKGDNAFHRACFDGNYDIVNLLLQNNFDQSGVNIHGKTGFSLACQFNRWKVLTLLLKMPTVTEEKEKLRCVEYFLACYHGHVKSLADQLDEPDSKSNDFSATDAERNTGFHLACQNGKEKIVSLLVEKSQSKGIDINAINQNGDSGFHQASSRGHHKIVDFLIKSSESKGIETTSTNREGTVYILGQKGLS